jgi:glucokinase
VTHEVALAIDIGATKLAGALVDRGGRLYEHRRRPTRTAPDGGDLVWPDLAALVDELLAAADGPVTGVGVGSAGPLDLVTGSVSPVNIPSWRGFPLVAHLSAHTGGLAVELAGDGICAAIGEHWLGAARGLDDVVVLVVSTGVGGGVIQRGRLHAGRSGNAGHVGHMVVDLDGDACTCGGRGCVETMASGPSMVAWAVRNGWCTDASSPSAVELAAAARAGDKIAVAAFERSARALAAGVVSVAAASDVAHAVIAGGVSRASDLLLPPLRRAIGEYARLDFIRDLEVRLCALGAFAGLYGAAALVLDPDPYSRPASTSTSASTSADLG